VREEGPALLMYIKRDHRCLRNLANYRAPKRKMKFPRSQCAAVLVALFVGRMGDLYVLLSR
jgi:coenzyme A diphosphatase NUDT7